MVIYASCIVDLIIPVAEKSTDGTIGCIIYQDDYDTMPEVLKGLKVKTFKCLSHTGLPHEPNKWDIWVV